MKRSTRDFGQCPVFIVKSVKSLSKVADVKPPSFTKSAGIASGPEARFLLILVSSCLNTLIGTSKGAFGSSSLRGHLIVEGIKDCPNGLLRIQLVSDELIIVKFRHVWLGRLPSDLSRPKLMLVTRAFQRLADGGFGW